MEKNPPSAWKQADEANLTGDELPAEQLVSPSATLPSHASDTAKGSRDDKTAVIRYHSWIAESFLAAAAGTAGIWGICLPVALLCLLGTWHSFVMPMGTVALVGMAFLWVIGTIFTCLLADNRLILEKEHIIFPSFVTGAKRWSDLRIARLGRKKTCPGSPEPFADILKLYFKPGGMVTLTLSGLSQRDLSQFLSAIEKRAPQCKLQRSVKLLEARANEPLPAKRTRRSTSEEISYRPYADISKFFQIVISYEKHYWRVWLLTMGLFLAATAPFFILYVRHLIANDPMIIPRWLDWLRLLMDFVGTGFSTGGDVFFRLVTNPAAATFLFGITAVSSFSIARMVLQPNTLRLTADGLKLYKKLSGIVLPNKTLSWSAVEQVKLFKPRRSTVPERWSIELMAKESKPLRLKLGAIPRSDDRQRLLKCINEYAPSAQADPELLEALMPAQKRSYTELWLQSLSAPPKRERLAPLSPGAILQHGEYNVIRQLGIGGQGVAYLCQKVSYDPAAARQEESATSERQVVLKEFILPVYVDKNARRQALERFEHEASMLQRLDHPQVVKLMDFFIEDHRGYLVLEHIDGVSLHSLVATGGPLSDVRVRKLALQMCSILEYLHSLSPPVVHRDFTPDNLILSNSGTLKLIDFNVAQQRESTTTGTVVGKHAYLPPEQFRGKPTPQSDIYAFGATLFYLLTGQDPEPLTPSHPLLLQENTDPALDKLIGCCTDLDAARRPANTADIRLLLAPPTNDCG